MMGGSLVPAGRVLHWLWICPSRKLCFMYQVQLQLESQMTEPYIYLLFYFQT